MTLKTILVDNLKVLLDGIIPLIVGLALIYFIWGLAQYISNSGEASKVEEGRTRMLWGTIALFVIVSVWGLVAVIRNSVFTGTASLDTPPSPEFKKQN